jgi:hypothetical protein
MLSIFERLQASAISTMVFAVLLGAWLAGGVRADNLAANPSAEQVAADGTPVGWGLYVGSGRLKLTSTSEQKHSGERSACLETIDWYTPPGAADATRRRTVGGAIMLAPNDGYRAGGALACSPGVTYAFSFWYKGDVPKASVSAVGWPSADADDTKRIRMPVSGGEMSPGAEWRKSSGRFHIPDGVQRFALGINVSGGEREGFALGKKLYVDDADIRLRMYPDGELRAIWGPLPKSMQRDAGLREIAASLDKIKAGGLNTFFVWTPSAYFAALDQPELQKREPQAGWDGLKEVLRAAKERRIEVHLWYSPWIYKEKSRAVELQRHPEWAAVSAKGVADADGICFVRPEVRRFEVDLIANVIDRYPDLAGVHIEEPGYNWGHDFCYCDYCRQFCLQNFGLDIRKDPQAAKPTVHSLAAFMCTDFFRRLRTMMAAKRPEMWLSANGGSGDDAEWYIGRDWHTWARRGLIDFYVPQLYTKDVQHFTEAGLETKACLGGCDMVAGMAVSWSGIYPARQPPELIQAEIAAARKLGAKGFVVYYAPYLQEEHYQAIRAAIQVKRNAESKP